MRILVTSSATKPEAVHQDQLLSNKKPLSQILETKSLDAHNIACVWDYPCIYKQKLT